MADNPYQAPRASLADQPEPDRPKQIKIAVALMCASLIASAIFEYYDFELLPEEQEYATAFYFFGGITLLIVLIPIGFIWFRHSWARWVWLVLTLIGWFLTITSWDANFKTLDIAREALYAVLDAIAVLLIFSGAGARWFKTSPRG